MSSQKNMKASKGEIHQVDAPGLVKSNWDLVREALKKSGDEKTLKLVEDGLALAKSHHDSLVSFAGIALNYVAQCDEEAIEKLYRERYGPMAEEWLSSTPGVEESVQRFAKVAENPFYKVTVIEEPDRYVMTLDPCRSGGLLRHGMRTVSGQLTASSIGTTRKAYPWSWGKSGVSYYCIHCCMAFEVIPIELRGYPISVIQYAEKPEDPCIRFFYKRPELIPEEYFTRLGKVKKIK